MRFVCAAVFASVCFGAAQAQEPPAPPLVSPERQGYAFEYPRVLAEQRLFGIAHGVSLLSAACLDDTTHADTAAEAYTQWYTQQQAQLDSLKDELAAFYYGPHAEEATWAHIADVLHLRKKLELSKEQLAASCASLPQALQQPRYDLTARFRLEVALAEVTLATRIEALAESCSPLLPEASRAKLAEQYAAWQTREHDAVAAARAALQTEWKNNGLNGDMAEWQKALTQQYAKPPAAVCQGLSTWLQTPAASLAQSFAPAPAAHPVAKVEDTSEHAAAPVTREEVAPAAPSAAPDTAQTTTTQDTAPPAAAPTFNLFDTLMRLFDERSDEPARAPRPPRAYP